MTKRSAALSEPGLVYAPEPDPAPLMEEELLARRTHFIETQLPFTLREVTFENWEHREGLEAVYTASQKYADGFPILTWVGHPSLWLYSATMGTGKTRLCAMIGHRIVDRWDTYNPSGPFWFMSSTALGSRIRNTYNKDSDESDEDIYYGLAHVPLLILDDVGDRAKEPPTEHSRRMYYRIVNDRYVAGMPIILASNVQGQALLDLLGEGTVDRLYEMTGGHYHELKVSSYRTKGGIR